MLLLVLYFSVSDWAQKKFIRLSFSLLFTMEESQNHCLKPLAFLHLCHSTITTTSTFTLQLPPSQPLPPNIGALHHLFHCRGNICASASTACETCWSNTFLRTENSNIFHVRNCEWKTCEAYLSKKLTI